MKVEEGEEDKDREVEFLLTTIISDGSKVMHSQPRRPPSCLPKLNTHTDTHSVKTVSKEGLYTTKNTELIP